MLSNVKQFSGSANRYTPPTLEIAFYLCVGVWLVWLTSVSLLSGKPPAITSPYVVVPVVLIGRNTAGAGSGTSVGRYGRTLELAFVALALAILAHAHLRECE